MLVTFLPFAFQPARAAASARLTFVVNPSVDPAHPAYVGEVIWWSSGVYEGTGRGPYQYSFEVYKDGNLIAENGWSENWLMYYMFTSPGKYKVRAGVWDRGANEKYYQFSDEITVKANPNRIIKVEPVSATSLKITWSTVPGAEKYHLFRSTDMKNWDRIETTFGSTFFINNYLKTGTRYFYKVEYYRPVIYGLITSNIVAGVPMAKTRITSITSPSARRIRMTWARAAGASGYQVAMASRANGSYKSVRIVTGGTTAIFSGVRSGSTLYFKVRPYRRVYTTTCWGQYSAYRSIRVK